MIVKTSDLPKELLLKLPLSVRIQKVINTSKLPISLKYEIENYLKNNVDIQIQDINKQILDIIFDKGIYDIKHLTSPKDVIIQYIKNFLLTRKGSYPFDPEFGTLLYTYLETKDLDYIGSMIAIELNDIINQITTMFDEIDIKVEKLNIYPIESEFELTYYIHLEMSINNETTTIELNVV